MPRWLNFSGAPALLLPRAFAHGWRGFYLPFSGKGTPDLELEDGGWQIHDAFDFENPRTDYDRLCATLGDGPLLVPVGAGYAVAFGGGNDCFTWWPERSALVAGGSSSAFELVLDVLPFARAFDWDVPHGGVRLINSCQHGDDRSPDEEIEVSLEAGRYCVEWTYAESNDWYCRFIRSR